MNGGIKIMRKIKAKPSKSTENNEVACYMKE